MFNVSTYRPYTSCTPFHLYILQENNVHKKHHRLQDFEPRCGEAPTFLPLDPDGEKGSKITKYVGQMFIRLRVAPLRT